MTTSSRFIGPSYAESMSMMEMAGLRDENERLRAALTYYAKPRAYGKGEHSVFIDDTGVARTALAVGNRCTICGHVHDPEAGHCDAHAHAGIGRCPCPARPTAESIRRTG